VKLLVVCYLGLVLGLVFFFGDGVGGVGVGAAVGDGVKVGDGRAVMLMIRKVVDLATPILGPPLGIYIKLRTSSTIG
jgi:hypothetical protein